MTESLPAHRLVDADLALESLAQEDPGAVVLGVGGGGAQHHEDFTSMLRHTFAQFSTQAPVGYTTVATGPRSTRQVVALGVRLLRYDGSPVAILQRGANPSYGRERATIDLVSAASDVAAHLLEDLRQRMNELSVVRGNVVSFAHNEFGSGLGGMTFLERPDVAAESVILPSGVLQRVRDHVVGIGEQADLLRAGGQHLKRGVLLYGPPGTGKTHTVRHLLHETPDVTAVLLQGSALSLVSEAAQLARALAPAIVVLEDVDLVAADRVHFGIQPLLFEVLDALDGIDGDADVAFVLTTNRVEALEPALAARPGRVDLAVEIPLPDAEARRVLFRLYGAGVPLSTGALDAAADRADGVTASFAKELIRRAVLRASLDGRSVVDADLGVALEEMLEASAGIGRALFGGEGAPEAGVPAEDGPDGPAGFGWTSYAPGP